MATRQIEITQVKRLTANEKYLAKVFSILKKRDSIVIAGKNMNFSDNEFRLLGEIITEKRKGRRLIATELAKRLGVTRSAVSQMVNRLEAEGVVQRLPDDTDRKIAYIDITKTTEELYEKDLKICSNFIGKVIKEYGKDKFDEMCSLLDSFIECVHKVKNEEKKK